MNSSWRQRPTGSWFHRLWRPWSSLNPFRRPGQSIHEGRQVGIKDLVASPEEVGHRPVLRWRIIGSFFVLLFVVLVMRLFTLQVLQHQSSLATANYNGLRVSTIPANRGYILDRSGNALVTNVSTTQIQLSQIAAAQYPQDIGSLALLTHQSMAAVALEVKNPQYNAYQPSPILRDAPATMTTFIKLHASEFPGVQVVPLSQRAYPFGGSTGSQVLGYVGPITGAEIAANPDRHYQTSAVIGKTGVESYYESFLRGIDGVATSQVDASGSIVGRAKTVAPRIGNTLVLNIDAGLQRALDGYLAQDVLRVRRNVDPVSGVHPKALNGSAIVMDPTTGAVLAMSSYPSFDLNSFTNGLSQKTFNVLLNNGSFTNYPIQGLFTPGSTFKMISATAMMQSGILSPNALINDTGSFTVPGCTGVTHGCVFHDDQGRALGIVNLPSALTQSSDYYFYNLGYLFWSHQKQYGETPIQNVAASYGLGQYSNIDLPNEVQGRVDSPAVRQQLHAAAPLAVPNVSWYTGDNIEMSFGQGATAVTPIEMANAYATFANGGTRFQPEVAAAVLSPGGHVVVRYGSRVLGHVNLPPNVRNPILQGLIGVVNNPAGTAYAPFHQYATFNLNNFLVAGKTGTASNQPGQEPNSWFISFAPALHPRYVVMCVIGQGGYGADAAAPVVAQAYNYLVAHPVGPIDLRSALPRGVVATGAKK
jgi:penicillin-binding protein 2